MEVRQYHISGHIFWGYSLKFRPEKQALYMVGTSNKSIPKMTIENYRELSMLEYLSQKKRDVAILLMYLYLLLMYYY